MEIFHGVRFKEFLEETKKRQELKESLRKEGPLDSFSKDLKDSIKKRNYEKDKNV